MYHIDILKADIDNEEFLDKLYKNVLGRYIDESGKKYYLEQLNKGVSRKKIYIDIASSTEAIQKGYKIPEHLKNERVKPLKVKKHQRNIRKFVSKIQKSSKLILPNEYNKKLKSILALLPIKEVESSTSTMESQGDSNIIVEQNINTNQNLEVNYISSNLQKSKQDNQLWFDLTTSFEWQDGVVGIVRAELQIAKEIKQLEPSVRFFMYFKNGFVEIESYELNWLFEADSVADEYLKFFKRKNFANLDGEKGQIRLSVPKDKVFYSPFKDGDMVFSMGWMDSNKEQYFTILKTHYPKVFLSYLVYDTILVNPLTRHFYHSSASEKFSNYIKWISENCDYIFFGGETAKKDLEGIQKLNNWSAKDGSALKFGSDVHSLLTEKQCQEALKELGINRDFILTVGSIEPRKNHDTLYRAYLRALEMVDDPSELPMLIICGSSVFQTNDLLDNIARNPKLKGHVVKISANDIQLGALYQKCQFTLLPSVYEGWSLTLPESLGYGKLCLCSDTPPLREIGQSMIDYIPSYDIEKWAEKIIYYATNKNALELKEKQIQENWKNITWNDTAKQLLVKVNGDIKEKIIKDRGELIMKINSPKYIQGEQNNPVIWMDMTTSFLNWGGGITGIIRAELSYARYLYQLDNNTRFFALHFDEPSQKSYFFEITHDCLEWLFNDLDLSTAYRNFRVFWDDLELNKGIFRNPLINNSDIENNTKLIKHFDNSIIASVGVDIMFGDGIRSILEKIAKMRESGDFKNSIFVQMIYDFTPTLYAHLHVETACWNFEHFLKATFNHADFIVYGGETALLDGLDYEKENKIPHKPSEFIKFGSDIDLTFHISKEEEEVTLGNLGIEKNQYILTVGTIEPRKNHEMLYKAYQMKFLEGKLDEMPMLVIAGKPGWKVNDFIDTIKNDTRFKDKILLITPTDKELDVLYNNCAFTVLPTFYEGWSLTLPESLSKSKFCLSSNAAPLKEIGKDMITYANPLNTKEWAEKISFYYHNSSKVKEFETKIKNEWHPTTWEESAKYLREMLIRFYKNKGEK